MCCRRKASQSALNILGIRLIMVLVSNDHLEEQVKLQASAG